MSSMWIKFFMDDIRIHIDGIGVIYEAKLKPSTWMMFRLQTIRMEMMNWDKFLTSWMKFYQTHGLNTLDCDEF
jgi:hypothetical protein